MYVHIYVFREKLTELSTKIGTETKRANEMFSRLNRKFVPFFSLPKFCIINDFGEKIFEFRQLLVIEQCEK